MADSTIRTTHRSLTVCADLPPLQRDVLRLVSIVYEPVNMSVLFNCLLRSGIAGQKNVEVTQADLARALESLGTAGLVNDRNQCASPRLAEEATREAVAAGVFPVIARAVQAELPLAGFYGRRDQKCWRIFREYRIGIHTHDIAMLESLQPLVVQSCGDVGLGVPVVLACASPFDPVWFATLPVSCQYYLINELFSYSLKTFEPVDGVVEYLTDESGSSPIPDDERLPFHRLLAEYLLWQGDVPAVRDLISGYPDSFRGSGMEGCLAFLAGDNTAALEIFETDLRDLRKITGRRKLFFFNISGLFYVLALLRGNDDASLAPVRSWIGIAREHAPSTMLQEIFSSLEAMVVPLDRLGTEADVGIGSGPGNEIGGHGIIDLFSLLARHWASGGLPNRESDRARLRAGILPLFQRARDGRFYWIAMEYAGLLDLLGGDPAYGEYAASVRDQTGLTSLIKALPVTRSWERRLNALISVAAPEGGRSLKKSRLVWCVSYDDGMMTINPKEQKVTSLGEWSKGRPVALSRLHAGRQLDFLTEQDLRICSAVRREYKNYQKISYSIDPNKALPAMIGHPLLFLEGTSGGPLQAVEFSKGEPEVVVEETDEGLRIRLAREVADEAVTVIRESPNRFKIIEMDKRHHRIARIIGRDGLSVPPIATEMVMAAIGNLASFMTVHSAIAMDSVRRRTVAIREVEAEERIWIQLLPFASGFTLKMFVRPFGKGGPYLKPGKGVEVLMAEVAGQRLQTTRNLEQEEARAREVENECPTLAASEEFDREWHLRELDDCLQILLELQPLQEMITVEWPEGERISVSRQASFDQLKVRVRRRRNWFELGGRLEVDEDMVLDMRHLLEMARRNTGRFIPLGEGQFLALTDELRARLDDLGLFVHEGQEKGDGEDDEDAGRLHLLAAPVLAEFCELAGAVDSDAGWQEQLARLEEMREFSPRVPSTLRAELRSYQEEGYVWLARLAHWGVGACLADDMGLGKTLQALAVILGRAQAGPTLVVAPTSVCMNWVAEAARFAPTLTVHIFGGKERASLVRDLGKFDMLVTSYTLLQQEGDLLASVAWETIVLDEAQAIKNMATKRSRAAMALDGGFKLLLTGTPIENHLGELWNLFNFINPGLLSSLEKFNLNFAVPIERYQDREAGRKLRKMIRPFMLRRIKSQVLEELPPRTEVVLHVEMSEEERAFYEALRRQAIASLENAAPGTGQNMQILAEIMRLRRTCCNTRLVAPDSDIPSSKLELFGSVLDELLENRHQVLVFSQFVGHLQFIRQYLDEMGIPYCYLDGSTSIKDRKAQVDTFQAGGADVFLISLKAGGLGLNLTAADYVIHMDPWWNPAVEDQASDRAHRIGQTRPVTIYRLVTKNTIEEKIVALHNEKRELADSLLQGSDVSARISVEELLNLIREQ